MVINIMKIISVSCKTLFAFILVSCFLTACGGDKQPTTTADQATTPGATPEEAATESTVDVTAEPEKKTTMPESQVTEPQQQQPKLAQTEPAQEQTSKPSSTTTQQDEMLALAKKSGCMACHAIDKKVVGPGWKDVAKRYAGDAGAREQLIEKVSKGGKGNWTEVVGSAAMPPYHPRVSKENIAKLVDFVLSLSN